MNVNYISGRFKNIINLRRKMIPISHYRDIFTHLTQTCLQFSAHTVYCYVNQHNGASLLTSPTSQLILQPFHRFTYITAHSPTLLLLHLRYSSFSNPSFASPTSQTLHLIHLANRPWIMHIIEIYCSFKWNIQLYWRG